MVDDVNVPRGPAPGTTPGPETHSPPSPLGFAGLPPAPPQQWQPGSAMSLRPLRVGEMLDAAIKLYRQHWKTFMAMVAIITVPFVFLQHLAVAMLGAGDPFDPVSGARTGVISTTIAFAALDFLLIRPFLTAAIVRSVAIAYLGGVPAVGPAYDFALRRLWSILWVVLLGILAIVGIFVPIVGLATALVAAGSAEGAVLVFLPGVVLAVVLYIRWLFGPAVVVVEDQRGKAALARSWRLSSHAFWKIVGTTLLAWLLTGIVGGLFSVVPTLLSAPLGSAGWLVRAAGSAVASVVTTPFVIMVTVLLYFDQRIRKEGLDLAIMAQEL